MTENNLAGRAGAWAAANPKTALGGWIAFVAVAVALGAVVGTKSMPDNETATGQSARAQEILDAAGLETRAQEGVLIQFKTRTAANSELYGAIDDVTKRLRLLPNVADVRSPLQTENSGLIVWDTRSALVPFRIQGDADDAAGKVQPILDALKETQRAHPHLNIIEVGSAGTAYELNKTIRKDFRRVELTTLPLTMAILLVVFGAFVAAGLPVLLAFSGVLATLGLTGLASHAFPASDHMSSVVLLVGMAVGIDYSLFYLRREREERAKGLSQREALLAAARTSGRAVFVSGLIVLVSLAGMFLSGSKIFTSFAVGTILMVAVALIGSLTVVPAVLSLLGDRVTRGRIPFLGRGLTTTREPRVWPFVLDRVLRRPLLSAVLATAALLALAWPALGLQTKLPGLAPLPAGFALPGTQDQIEDWVAGAQAPTVVVAQGDMTSMRAQMGLAHVASGAVTTGLVKRPIVFGYNDEKTVGTVTIPLKGNGTDATAAKVLDELRTKIVPETIGAVPGVTTAVTGKTASADDFDATMARRMPIVFAFVLLLVFALLLVAFRSIVIPLKAVLLNLLSVGAAYGVLVLVFQHRWAEGILGFESNGAIVSWLPMFLFVILFGLSMDYHVFILSRIKELVDGGMDTDEAVSVGIKRTAGVVTSAALVMVAVFLIFATLNVLELKQMGVGLAAAILIDATLVRGVLLPATMKLLGKWNWYLPRWLDFLPRVRIERERSAQKLLTETV